MLVVILVKQLLGIGLLCSHNLIHSADITGFFLLGKRAVCAGSEFLCGSVVFALCADPRPAVDLDQSKVIAVSQNIAAHKQSRIILQSEKVGESGENINSGTRLVHNDRLGHGCAPEQEAVAVKIKVIADAVLRNVVESGEITVAEGIGIMILSNSKYGVFQFARFFKRLNQNLQHQLNFILAGVISLNALRLTQESFRQILFVTACHGVAAEGVVGVTADAHIIRVERMIKVYIILGADLCHFLVRARPAVILEGKAVIGGFPGVTEIRVRLVASVVCIRIVVISQRGVTELFKLIAQGQRLVFGTAQLQAVGCGVEVAGHTGIFTGCGTSAPHGIVEVFENKALGGHLVKRRSKLRINDLIREAFQCDKDKILSLEHARVLALLRGLNRLEILVHIFQRCRAGVFRSLVKVNVHHIVAVLDFLFAFALVVFFSGKNGCRRIVVVKCFLRRTEHQLLNVKTRGIEYAVILKTGIKVILKICIVIIR